MKKKDALQKANSLLKKAENVHTPSTIKRKLKVKDKEKRR